LRLEGRVALITGASKFMGGTIASFMAQEGAKIAVNDIVPEVAEETAAHIRSKGHEAIAIPGDITDETSVKSMVAKTVDAFGYVDILVNNAGKQYQQGVLDIELDKWNQQIAIFLTGTMLFSREVSKVMVDKERKGCILTIISTAGHQGQAGNLAYCTCKAGLLNFTRAAAMDLARYGIRVNCITPTSMEHALYREGTFPGTTPRVVAPSERTPTSFTRQEALEGIPTGRFTRTADIAKTAVFLASDDAQQITGENINVDGGVLARYWPWLPGKFTGITVDDYKENVMQPLEWGEIPGE
jgi:NAD(P)-dependent dehydrogenase (short-subunit alcohol dehydrogenase family)